MQKTKRTLCSFGTVVVLAVVATMALATASGATTSAARTLAPNTRFYVPKPDKGAILQAADLLRKHDFLNAARLALMVSKGHAVWLTGGTPTDVQKQVKQTMLLSFAQRAVPAFVAYDIPGRDCAQYSKGGALNLADYEAWIDGVARGIGNGRALVILEPDSLGLLPSNCGFDPSVFSDDDRYAELNYAVDKLELNPNVSVYLDGTHPDWLGVDVAATRLVTGGVERAEGFFLNASNYQYSDNAVQYGAWISKCIAQSVRNSDTCANKFWNGGPLPSLIAQTIGEWNGDSLSPYGVWSDTDTTVVNGKMPFNTSGINLRHAGDAALTHFVVDTSRSGKGPWDTQAAGYGDKGTAQDWCNAPGRGVGIAPTANTGNPLVDAYLWVKVPGESDGQCNRGVSGSTTDPAWGGITDPAAGEWFPQMALQLAQNATPKLHP